MAEAEDKSGFFSSAFSKLGAVLDETVDSVAKGIGMEEKNDPRTQPGGMHPSGQMLDENGLLPPPPVRDTPRTHGREAIVAREKECRKKNGFFQAIPDQSMVAIQEEPAAPVDPGPTPRQGLSAEQADEMKQVFDLFAEGGDHFTKEQMCVYFGGWNTEHLDFHKMDKNGDGKVDLEEWSAYCEKEAFRVAWSAPGLLGKLKGVQNAAKGVKADKEARAKREEEAKLLYADFLAQKQAAMEATEGREGLSKEQVALAFEVFELIDVNKSGTLTKSEILAQYGGHDTGMFQQLDANQDGAVSPAEFLVWLNTFRGASGDAGPIDNALNQMKTSASAIQQRAAEKKGNPEATA